MERIKNADQLAFCMLYDRLWEPMYIKAIAILGNVSL